MGTVLVAGIGNVFLSDDGFGVEVARRLRRSPPAGNVDVADFGVRGIHLARELVDRKYDAAILVDAVARGGAPGTLYEIDPDDDCALGDEMPDAHSVTPAMVLGWLHRLGAGCRVIVVGCEPASLEEGMALSPAVAGVIDDAVRLVHDILWRLTAHSTSPTGHSPRRSPTSTKA